MPIFEKKKNTLIIQWLIVVIMGCFLIYQDRLIEKILGWLSIVFFGGGGIFVMLRSFIRKTKQQPAVTITPIKKPEPILVKRNLEPNEEELEKWLAVCNELSNYIKKPESIVVKRDDDADEEILEGWYRDKLSDAELQRVYVTRWDWSTFPWAITFGVCDCIRSHPYAEILGFFLTQELLKVPGVTKAIREDRDHWIVEGTMTGDALVRAGSMAVDAFLDRYADELHV